jgi:hypothetical protein
MPPSPPKIDQVVVEVKRLRKTHPAPGGAGPFSRLWVGHKSWPLRSLVVLERE